MKLSEIKQHLSNLETIAFELPDGSLVPNHFHVTEVGQITKNFIDCGGTIRKEEVINFQLWDANDYDHRLHPEKLVHIINLSEKVLGLNDLDIEVEYQGTTIGKFGLDFNGKNFLLTSTNTACLAQEACGIPEVKTQTACAPNSGCC
ncbi:DUF6428 family protein [Flavobacteriaceae bacterium S356]|uniref:DUF6428 family protein n=1 Tax=Asprobacillus argus TaxID=3076534 RepID=A0ABU3LK17_9FLAO|nr:DUF6428 family protein [Flavobacteriaceae bacterium S356]